MSILVSMAAFALAMSISPGPVNIVALGIGARRGFSASMPHVSGATFGFTLLFWLTGQGLHQLLERWPHSGMLIQWAGVAFLFYMAYKLTLDNSELGSQETSRRPTFMSGAAMQWLNPKAWLASLAGIGAYVPDGDKHRIWQFTAIYFLICYASIACWAYAGSFLRRYLQHPPHVRLFNRMMALLLAGGAIEMFIG
ncbi:MAG: LysE family translocator [Betaproteobacteria bacterium]|nr:LysE family translocator [Betaproteobacteria bacterium]